ncbi:hypothetical protein [Comamonas jiangduensis]|uniref:hypothetical protein n=1 Tax=Comamonas jiangduensis TaxID=1194168 RepID=UPI003BF82776
MLHQRDSQLLLALRGLPEIAYIDNDWDKSPHAPPVIAVKRGEMGYYPIFTTLKADALNAIEGVSEAQREAMHVGSMIGWHVPGAFPQAHAAGADYGK